ncbi:ASCH domain-containing protein [Labrys wisconsinensis]|uniref:ASCH domain-containing protein n=1 Tax=Labrys wisconsinensis TaxID=425677 RepID=A0ABU0JES7_9HYPH|nr:ASCH domain-containing protein [Labrys wisconsinensis]MDQ0472778.1 hypothetical protein [Labrys wisconsinensis]
MKALSIMQPWAWLIVNGHKDVENRDWPTAFRGPVLIHAGKKLDEYAAADVRNRRHPVTGERLPFDCPTEFETGGIIGEAQIVGCFTASKSPWFVGKFGFLIHNARPLPFRPCRGMLGFFEPDFTPIDPKPKPAAKVGAQGSLF